jgi:hypothetical protein
MAPSKPSVEMEGHPPEGTRSRIRAAPWRRPWNRPIFSHEAPNSLPLVEDLPESAEPEEPGFSRPIVESVIVRGYICATGLGHRNAFDLIGDPAVGREQVRQEIVYSFRAVADEAAGRRASGDLH